MPPYDPYTHIQFHGSYHSFYMENPDPDAGINASSHKAGHSYPHTYIPDTITINGTVYRVTSVGEKAFYKNRSLKKIVISGYIEKINAKAFYGCTSLKEITITSTKLKTGSIGANAFKKVNKNVRIIVPTSKYKAYKKLLKKAGIGAKAQIYKMKNL